ATPSTPRRPRWQPAAEAGPVLASARVAEPQAASEPAPAPAAGSIGFRINFALNSDVVPQSAFPFVERIGELLRDQPQVKLRVEGHTDALGSDDYNLQLSQRRAVAVAQWLVERQGIDPSRLVVLGRGEEAPLVENGFDPRNRRVQFARVE
ncbi:MAG: OmpA family protein, partial [Acetobacteraceae bacterium]